MSSVLDELVERIIVAESCFRRALSQVMVLNRVIAELQRRYDMAMKQHARNFRYSQRVRIAVTEGVRNMFYEYARQKADLIVQLRQQIDQEQRSMEEAEQADVQMDESHNYGDEYDLSDSELDYSDIDFSDLDDEDDDENAADESFNRRADFNKISSEERTIEKVSNDTDLNETVVSVDSGYLDESIDDDSFNV